MSATATIPGYTAGRWDIDPANSAVTFTVRHMLVNTMHGRFNVFAGEVVTRENPLESTVAAAIETSSIDSNDRERDEHLRAPEYLDVSAHPLMSYRSTALREDADGYVLDGELTLKGMSRQVPLWLEPGGILAPDPIGKTRMGIAATGSIDRADFGLSSELLDMPLIGGLLVSRRVEIRIDIEATLAR
ncbi:YceI family protein [Dactylosporangium fulvum]|uniref:YceI family protein n=1 Tax=Dactylosporangium fulvum TaxID=53359 RepID=A0ABY5WB47_9ACTN|nr:YceI family protein [Dactylosporangium fulvum]UWP86694.1 YceI family protein [Dactylosporangium fulvum]